LEPTARGTEPVKPRVAPLFNIFNPSSIFVAFERSRTSSSAQIGRGSTTRCRDTPAVPCSYSRTRTTSLVTCRFRTNPPFAAVLDPRRFIFSRTSQSMVPSSRSLRERSRNIFVHSPPSRSRPAARSSPQAFNHPAASPFFQIGACSSTVIHRQS
jgi:hypothetical protein